MDPKHRGNSRHDTPLVPPAISPSYYFSIDQAHGAGHMDPEFRRLQHGYIRNDYLYGLHHPHSRPQDMQEVIRREIEKERIREEIIMSEIVRRRVLEAEVRRELMMDREMALRSGRDWIPCCSSPVMRLESPMRSSNLGTRAEGRSAEERLGMALEDKEKQKGRRENGALDALPYQRRSADLRISEVKPASEGNNEKENFFLLTKPDENVSGSKRKAVTPPEEELAADIIENKKAKEEWSCALCQVSATSEKVLEEHVLGKKHKLKEAALIAQRGGKNYTIGLFTSKSSKSNGVVGTIDLGEAEAVEHKAQSLLSEKAGVATLKKDDLRLLENLKSEHLKKTSSEVIRNVQKNEDDPKKKGCKFWCEMCQVGTLSIKVMNNHKKGKKHLNRLRTCEKNGGTGSINKKKSATLADCKEEASENGKNINSEKFNQPLDQASSEDHELLDAFHHREQGETLNSDDINLKKTPSEVIRNVQKNEDDSKKKGSKFWCEMCQVGTLSIKVMNGHKNGKKHLNRLRKCEKNGETGSINQKKSAALADCMEEASENGNNINSEKFNQPLYQASSEDHKLLDAFHHEEREGETLNSVNINKALDEKRPDVQKFLDAVELGKIISK